MDATTRIDTLGERVRAARKARGLTQTQLAWRCRPQTSQAVVQKIENGKSLRPRVLEDLAVALQVPPEWLAYGVCGVAVPLEVAIDERRTVAAWSSAGEQWDTGPVLTAAPTVGGDLLCAQEVHVEIAAEHVRNGDAA